ncbi:hypothetical protein BDF22DRAFT_42552 [Syncephalis plumigaleata]|nr:hypothetical protein BDF22DRAFT_42552 [Syncephalis plumigaleata]
MRHKTKTSTRSTTSSNSNSGNGSTVNLVISDDDDNDDNDEEEEEEEERERSLTPPPEFAIPRRRGHELNTQYNGEDDINDHLVDTENEIDTTSLVDLDPELQKIASDIPQQFDIGTTRNGLSSGQGTKIDILIKTIRHPQLPVTTQNALQLAEFERPLVFSMHSTEPFEALLDGYCQCKNLARNNVVLVFKNVRLYPHGTPHSLGITSNVEIEAFTVDTFEYISVERELSRKRKLAELVSAVEDDNSNVLADGRSNQASNETPVWIHLKIRDKAGNDEKLRVKPTTLVSTIINEYIRIRQLPETANVRLELEGDILDPQHKVGDTDVEDDDMLTAIVL